MLLFPVPNGLQFRGIGAGIAFELAARGANVVVNYTTANSKIVAEKVVQRILAASIKNGIANKAVAVQANVTESTGQQALVDAALALSPSGRTIDIIVHNAGNGDDRYLQDITPDFYTMQMDINVKGESTRKKKITTTRSFLKQDGNLNICSIGKGEKKPTKKKTKYNILPFPHHLPPNIDIFYKPFHSTHTNTH